MPATEMLLSAAATVPTLNYIISAAIIVAAIAVVLLIVFKLGKFLLKIIFGILANSILGIVALFLLNFLFNLGIPISVSLVIPIAIFGLPGLGTIILLKLLGISLAAASTQ
jgi:hypothetical protein